ncbi:MAG: glycosyltransferase family 39 protein [Tannerellaceae bacterium]|jgi:hypothetical protein|nr:glycosyltransferase family 39 protein [Tannerellaceae bacterium]
MKKNKYLPIVAAILILVFSVNDYSLWIDEMQTYGIVFESDFFKTLSTIWNTTGSVGGMPLFFILEWFWTQLFGYSEIAMRSINIPFAIVYFIFSYKIIRYVKEPTWLCLLFFFNPLFIYYMNEARPYIMLLCMGSVFSYLLFCCDTNRYKTLFWLHVSFLIGLLTHMMFGFIIILYITHCITSIRQRKLMLQQHLVMGSAFLLPYFAVLYHYGNVMIGAAELGGTGELSAGGLSSIAQIVYYLAGFGGLALSRNDLRAMMLSHLSIEHVVFSILLIAGYFTLFLYILKNKAGKNNAIQTLFLPALITLGVFCISNIILETRFWERHVIYLLPVILLSLCTILKAMSASGKWLYRIGAGLIVISLFVSSFNTMFNQYYRKENYKAVAACIKDMGAGTFLLQGDAQIYSYYGINVDEKQVLMINNISIEELDAIVMAKYPPPPCIPCTFKQARI